MASPKSPKQTGTPVLAVESIQTADLIPYARNSRTHDDAQVAQIAGSIREFGFTNPVLIDGANGIIAGHGRVMAARPEILRRDRYPLASLRRQAGDPRSKREDV